MADDQLFMVRAEFDRARLFELGRQLGVPIQRVDTGYLVHSALRALFGTDAPQPFAVQHAQGRRLPVLGYASKSHDAMQQHARAFADPLAYAACNVDGLASKAMPANWPEGHELAFEVRICPVVRKASAGPKHRKGAEVDAFLAKCWETAESVPVSREETYCGWLRAQLEPNGAVRLCNAKLVRFQVERLARRTHQSDRQWTFSERPNATLAGTLRITDGEAFRALIARGIGRHRAFGFGMLLLKPAETERC